MPTISDRELRSFSMSGYELSDYLKSQGALPFVCSVNGCSIWVICAIEARGDCRGVGNSFPESV